MSDQNEKTLSRRETGSALRLSIFAGCNGMIWVAVVLGMPLTMYLEALGASGLLLGLAMTAQQVAMSLQLPGGIIANRLRDLKKVWFVFALPHRLLWFGVALLPWLLSGRNEAQAVTLVIFVGISAMLANLASPAWFGWMSNLIPARESGRFWSHRQAFTMASFLVATALAGWLLDVGRTAAGGTATLAPFMLVFAIAALFGTADILIHSRVPSPPRSEQPSGRPFAAIMNVLRDRHFRMLTLAFGLWGVSLGMSSPFAAVYLKRTFSVSYSQLAAMTISFSLGTVIAGLFWGRIMDAVGARSFGSIMLMAVPLFAIPWFLLSEDFYTLPFLGRTPEAVVVYTVVNFFAGAFFSGVALCQINLLTTLATAESRTIAMSLHFTLTGLMGSIGPAIGGRIMDLLVDAPIQIQLPRGIDFSFFHVQVMLHITLAMAAAWIFHKTSPLVTDVPVRQLIGNPLRTLTIIQNLITVATPRNEAERARAIRRLSLNRIGQAMEFLEQALNDPSLQVRREAIRALGLTGAAESIVLLERHYRESGDTELFPAVALALGECGGERSAKLLLEMLDESPETKIEAVRALGRMGPDWVRHSLIHLLQHSQEPDIIEAAGSALASIAARQIAAKYAKVEAFRRLARKDNDVAVSELLQSLSDPSPDTHEALINALADMQSPAAIHALLHQLRSAEPSMKPRIARALAKNRQSDGIDMLIQDMAEADPETQLENARSLGETGDRRASGVLMEMVRHSEDARVVSASSEALVHLREVAAFYDIIPRMKTTQNPLLQRTLAVAAGNLLGESGSFYSFLIQEENLPGSQTARRLRLLRRRIRRLCSRDFVSAQAPLIECLTGFETAFELAEWLEAASRLFDLAVGLAALTYGIEHGIERKVFIEKLIWHNERIGVCVWFLYMITHDWNNPAFGPPSRLDVLLGLYALTEWNPSLPINARSEGAGARSPAPGVSRMMQG